jgi:hypothetical protein
MAAIPNDLVSEKGHERSQRGRRWNVIAAALVIGVTATLWLTFHFGKAKEYRSPTCGRTSTEARLLGCQYEPMLRSWIPRDCYSPEPADEYHPFDDREWFFDKALTRRMLGKDLNKLRNGDDITAYTKTFHDEHCLYAWRKLHLAVEKRLKLVDSKTMSLHHTTHCAKRVAKLIYNVGNYGYNESLAHTSTAPIMFQTCVQLPWKP